MTEYKRIEITVGLFVFVGIASMFYMALKLGEVGGLGASGYHLSAAFDEVGGVRAGADVMIAGVVVGETEIDVTVGTACPCGITSSWPICKRLGSETALTSWRASPGTPNSLAMSLKVSPS